MKKLDEMFHDLREDIKRKHIEQVHPPKQHVHVHEEHCVTHDHRRHSMPSPFRKDSTVTSANRRGSVPAAPPAAAVHHHLHHSRRSSLPAFPLRRDSLDNSIPKIPVQRKVSSGSASGRKFSRDSIDFDRSELEILDDSVILEEDEDQDYYDEVKKTLFVA